MPTPRRLKSPRPPGRPARAVITRDHVCVAAVALIEHDGVDRFTMRKLADALRVDPMAVYRHFEDKQDVIEAAAAYRYAQFRPRLLSRGTWRQRLVHLAQSYARFVRSSRLMVQYVAETVQGAAGPSDHFQGLFDEAIAGTALERAPPALLRCARDTVVDLVHGHTMADQLYVDALADELALVVDGIASRLRA